MNWGSLILAGGFDSNDTAFAAQGMTLNFAGTAV